VARWFTAPLESHMKGTVAAFAHGADVRAPQVLPYLVTAVVHVASSLPGLSALYLVFSMAGFLYWTVRQRDELALLVLLLGSSFSFTSLNVWNNGAIPGLPLLLLVLSLVVVGARIAISGAVAAAFWIVGMVAFSAGNAVHVGMSPVIVDLLVIVSAPLAALRFRRLSEHQFLLAFSACALITLAKMIVFAFMGVENPKLSTYTDASFLDTLDELTGFYLVFALLLISSPNPLRWVAIGLFGALIFHYVGSDNWLGYYGIGSQTLLTLFVFIIFVLVRFPVGLVVVAGAMVLLVPILTMSLVDTSDLKLQQLLSVFDIVEGSSIALLPHSVHVRVAEIATFFDKSWWQQLFGGGLGGYINLSDHFPGYLGPDDYSEQQINSGRITSPHNLGYLMIKFGYIGMALALAFLIRVYRATRRMTALESALFMTLGVFLILNLGYTLKISFLLGVLWVVIRNYSVRERATMRRPDLGQSERGAQV
jgi:hypothetical protein